MDKLIDYTNNSIKLNKNFLDNIKIKQLLSHEHGNELFNYYIKLIFLGAWNNGTLANKSAIGDAIPYSINDIASFIGLPISLARKYMNIYLSLGIILFYKNTFFIAKNINPQKEKIYSKGQNIIKNYLDSLKIVYLQEYFIKPIYSRYDFFLPNINLLIEFDGKQHFTVVEKWGDLEGYIYRRQKDIIKNSFANENQIPLLRIRYDQINDITLHINHALNNPNFYLKRLNKHLSNTEYYSIAENYL